MGSAASVASLVINTAPRHQCSSYATRSKPNDILMINLFGNTADSQKQRNSLSLRSAQAGDRKVTFRKPNSATEGLLLGLKFRESFGKAVYIDKILPNTEAARLEREGKIKVGDEVVMISATFGSEMWSARNVGKYRLEKSIAVRQGMTIDFVFEKAAKENARISRLQSQLTQEVVNDKKKGNFFGLKF